MKRLQEIDIQRLMWKQKGFALHDFELISANDLVGRMYWPKWLSDRAVAMYAENRWTLDRVGFFRDRIVVRDAKSGDKVADYEFDWLGDGTITLSDGQKFQWYRTKILCETWILVDEAGDTLLEFQVGMRWFKYVVEVNVDVRADRLPELPLLLFTCWYITFMRAQDVAAAVAVVSAAV
ncbi:MAG: hypothetical protein GTO18_22405 [Anaerolineales bacterium]|nr:hypothetical protein [Anaerolineales bacterium]